ncbi:hypothetical protein AACH06_04900 [Ideonella sp. DXS29W]|uniref:Uncharacterized protein n=1 Tax=Ideonella lacteola TaxID=2984193 RepID=A0ABU9BKX7_9BURK
MASEPIVPEPRRVATSDELRRAALARSAQRNALVARQRVRRRWWIWALIKLLQLAAAALLAGAGWWAAWGRDHGVPPAWLGGLPPDLQALVNRIAPTTPPQAQSPSSAAPGASNPTGEP